MVHNGIEYGDMQMICEAYDLMRKLLGMSAPEIAAVFTQVEHRRARQFPHRNHRRGARPEGSR